MSIREVKSLTNVIEDEVITQVMVLDSYNFLVLTLSGKVVKIS